MFTYYFFFEEEEEAGGRVNEDPRAWGSSGENKKYHMLSSFPGPRTTHYTYSVINSSSSIVWFYNQHILQARKLRPRELK